MMGAGGYPLKKAQGKKKKKAAKSDDGGVKWVAKWKPGQ